jgi:hypothetical protein
MDLSAIALMLAAKFPIVGLVLSGLGILVVVGLAVVALTPSKADDEAVEKVEAKYPLVGQVLKVLASFSPIQKK